MQKSISSPRSCSLIGRSILKFLVLSGLIMLGWSSELLKPAQVAAQESAIAPGEAFVSRFSGLKFEIGQDGEQHQVLDSDGVSGSVIDIRNPLQKPQGHHWRNEPQRLPVFAREVGQIFGIAIDDAKPANIYVSATAAFGLHRSNDNSAWANGMWGANGGPGTIYKLNASNNYQPEIFANVTLYGRENTAASLGNIAYDKVNKQLFVSDLETGMVHRFDIASGRESGIFNHGVDGRGNFVDVTSGEVLSLSREPFPSSSRALIDECETDFSTTPSCWNISRHKRRIWGLGVSSDDAGAVRLFYASWGALDNGAGIDDGVNWVWSIGLNSDGSFNTGDVRREVMVPILETDYGKVLSAPSDIAFSGAGVMLVAERGGMRHLKNDPESPFTQPGISRVLRFERSDIGQWVLVGPYGVGNLNGADDNAPDHYQNSGGGVAWGYGYGVDGKIDLSQKDQFVWASGDSLCSALGACFDLASGARTDKDHVTGVEGRLAKLLAGNLARSYKIDTDLNVNQFGQIDQLQATKTDDSKVGDIEIHVGGAPDGGYEIITPPPVYVPPVYEHSTRRSHGKYGSHAKSRSHYRHGSHNANKSHLRYGSHARLESHYRLWSHLRKKSHNRYASHYKSKSHLRYGSHNERKSHYRLWSHQRRKSHARYASHNKSKSHLKYGSHNKKKSHLRLGSHNKLKSHLRTGSHNKKKSHLRIGSHNKLKSHLRTGSHNKKKSHLRIGSHNKLKSHLRTGSHNKKKSHLRIGSHNKLKSHLRTGSHNKKKSHLRIGSHNKLKSHLRTGSHNKKKSHLRIGSHNKLKSHLRTGSHNKKKSHLRIGSHNKKKSHLRIGSHNKLKSHLRTGSHNKKKSHLRLGSHNKLKSHLRTGSHNKKKSHLRIGSHNKLKSHLRTGSHNKKKSHLRIGSHNKLKSHLRTGSHNKKKSHLRIGSHNKLKSHLRTGSHNKKKSHLRTGSHNKKKSHLRIGSHNKKASHLRIKSHNRKISHSRRKSHNKAVSKVRVITPQPVIPPTN